MAAATGKSGPSGPRVRPSNDIYTVMVAVALFAAIGAVAFAIYRCNELLGKPFPGF